MKRFVLTAALVLGSVMPALAQTPPPPPQGMGMRGMGMGDPTMIFDMADANHDGRVTRDEFAAALADQFAHLDSNGDGYITSADFAQMTASHPQTAARIDRMIAMADTNHDGKLSRDEFIAARMRLFDRADTNHDGVVDQTELAALRAQREERRDMRRGDGAGGAPGGPPMDNGAMPMPTPTPE